MTILKFKSNIKCSGCIARVTPALNNAEGIIRWQVDLLSPEKILSVETESLTAQDIQKIVEQSGFKAEPISDIN